MSDRFLSWDSQDKDGSKFYHLNMGAEIKIPSYYKITY